MAKKLIFTSVALLLVVGFLAGTKLGQFAYLMGQMGAMKPPAAAVSTFVAQKQQWRPVVKAVGTITAVQGVTISAQMAGNVDKISFESGAVVKEGDLLVHLDTSVEEAQLRSAEAGVALAKLGLDRSRDLLAKNSVSQSEFDQANAQFKQAEAQADNIRAVIAKKTVRAPFAGRLGIRLVNLGQTLSVGDKIVSLQSMDPVYADFFIPQQQLASVDVDQEVSVVSDVNPQHPVKGKVTAIAAEVDVATRNVKVQASLPNADGGLRPGMFVNVSVFEEMSRDVVVVPVTSVLYAAYGNSVYIVEKDKTGASVAMQHFVKLGETRGDFVEIVQGVEAGAEVVSAGAFKLRNGAPVSVDNSNPLPSSLTPKPADT